MTNCKGQLGPFVDPEQDSMHDLLEMLSKHPAV